MIGGDGAAGGAANCLVVYSQSVSSGLKSTGTVRVAVRDGLAHISAPGCPLIVLSPVLVYL